MFASGWLKGQLGVFVSTTSLGATAQAVADALCAVSSSIFAATWNERRGARELIVHVPAAGARRQLKAAIGDALARIGVAHFRVRFHAAADLTLPRSLERLVSSLEAHDIAYDPSLSLSRAKALVEAGRAVRTSFGERVRGLFYAPVLRTFYVTLEPSRVSAGEKVNVAELSAIEEAVGGFVAHFFGKAERPAVRIGFGLPATNLIAVDAASTGGVQANGFGRFFRRFLKPAASAPAGVTANSALHSLLQTVR